MIQHFIKIAWRHLWKRKIISFINLLGLSVAVASSLLIALYVHYESSYDQHFGNSDRIYRLARERQYPDRMGNAAQVGHSWGPALLSEIPEIESYCRIFKSDQTFYLKVGEQLFEEKKAIAVDSNFLEFFGIEMISGDPQKALTNPNAVVLTETAARKYFGDKDPIGQFIEAPLYTEENSVVRGVCKDPPKNSHFDFDVLNSTLGMPWLNNREVYIQFNCFLYFLLQEEADPQLIESKFPPLVEKYSAGQVEDFFGVPYETYIQSGNSYRYFFQAVTDIHLHSNLSAEFQPNGSAQLLRFLILIAIFILLIATINYMNLATARSSERAREVGIRKTFGSPRGYIVRQLLLESLLLTLFSTLIGVLLGLLALPYFNALTERTLTLPLFPTGHFILALFSLTIFLGLFAGSYPAWALSSFKPIAVLRGQYLSKRGGKWLRKGLVVFQYVISVSLIICTIVVFNQQLHIMTMDLGYNKDRLMVIKGVPLFGGKIVTFEEEIRKISKVDCVSRASTQMGGFFFGISLGKASGDQPILFNGFTAAEGFVECMEIEVLQGRSFSKAFNDTLSVLINKRAIELLGLENPIGQRLQTGSGSNRSYYNIIGVFANVNYQPLYQEFKPLAIFYDPGGWTNFVTVRLSGGEVASGISEVEKIWNDFLPGYPFEYTFMNDEWAYLHRRGQVSKSVFATFAALALLITCIGLLGLIHYMVETRGKEIGVRKVLGASSGAILKLLILDFLRLVLLAMLIAFPLSWYLARLWLQEFAHRITLDWWIFALAGSAAIVVTLLVVSYQSIKAAKVNPVDYLRVE